MGSSMDSAAIISPSISGLGLFACEDIFVPLFSTEADKLTLFPYCGMTYSMGVWRAISQYAPRSKVYALSADSYPDPRSGCRVAPPPDGPRMIDGDPVRCCNIAAYINSVVIPRSLRGAMRKMLPNVEWVHIEGPPPGAHHFAAYYDFHIVTCATRTIRAGEELLARYDMSSSM